MVFFLKKNNYVHKKKKNKRHRYADIKKTMSICTSRVSTRYHNSLTGGRLFRDIIHLRTRFYGLLLLF